MQCQDEALSMCRHVVELTPRARMTFDFLCNLFQNVAWLCDVGSRVVHQMCKLGRYQLVLFGDGAMERSRRYTLESGVDGRQGRRDGLDCT